MATTTSATGGGNKKQPNDKDSSCYDIILFGVTGFTGKLAVEYLLKRQAATPHSHRKGPSKLKWAACARNRRKAVEIIKGIVDQMNDEEREAELEQKKADDEKYIVPSSDSTKIKKYEMPPILIADLNCDNNKEKENALRNVLKRVKNGVVLTCCGPFELYGKTLVSLICEIGNIDYADITGETDFVRYNIQNYDAMARTNNSRIVCHCGNDCIPQDLIVYEMYNRYVASTSSDSCSIELKQVRTCVEFPDTASWSGGTAATATYQLSKDRSSAQKEKPAYDPLLTDTNGEKSEYTTKNISPKKPIIITTTTTFSSDSDNNDVKDDFDSHNVEPWIMGPVMVNCVRRSNALLHYSKEFEYGDMARSREGLAWWKSKANEALLGTTLLLPKQIRQYISPLLLPDVGEGPDRDVMENGYMTLHAEGILEEDTTANNKKKKKLIGKFHFNKDTGYLYTAAMLVETGLLLLETRRQGGGIDENGGGVLTPAAALGSQLTNRILDKLDTSLEIREVDIVDEEEGRENIGQEQV